jgi:hypothetical protein
MMDERGLEPPASSLPARGPAGTLPGIPPAVSHHLFAAHPVTTTSFCNLALHWKQSGMNSGFPLIRMTSSDSKQAATYSATAPRTVNTMRPAAVAGCSPRQADGLNSQDTERLRQLSSGAHSTREARGSARK